MGSPSGADRMTLEMQEFVKEPAIKIVCVDVPDILLRKRRLVSPSGVTPPHAGLASPIFNVALQGRSGGEVSINPSKNYIV